MKPNIIISYRTESGVIEYDTLVTKVPDNTYGAQIYQTFPVIDKDGNFIYGHLEYDLWIGNEMFISEVIDRKEAGKYKKDLLAIKAQGHSAAVFIPNTVLNTFNGKREVVGVKPLKNNDGVYSSVEELAAAIEAIKKTSETIIHPDVKNTSGKRL